jgi:hypothetical protein
MLHPWAEPAVDRMIRTSPAAMLARGNERGEIANHLRLNRGELIDGCRNHFDPSLRAEVRLGARAGEITGH